MNTDMTRVKYNNEDISTIKLFYLKETYMCYYESSDDIICISDH